MTTTDRPTPSGLPPSPKHPPKPIIPNIEEDTVTTTAYIQGSRDPITLGGLQNGGTLTVDGATYEIPANNLRGDFPAPERIAQLLKKAGYRLADDYVYAVELPDRDGVFAVRVVPA